MAHEHDSCTTCDGTGVLYDYCDYESCDNERCTEVGHCDCKCHSGKTCPCGRHSWPRMEKSNG